MFEETFTAELATNIGSKIEVTTDNIMIEGLLSSVTESLVLVIDVTSGYGNNVEQYISVDSINFVRFPAAA